MAVLLQDGSLHVRPGSRAPLLNPPLISGYRENRVRQSRIIGLDLHPDRFCSA